MFLSAFLSFSCCYFFVLALCRDAHRLWDVYILWVEILLLTAFHIPTLVYIKIPSGCNQWWLLRGKFNCERSKIGELEMTSLFSKRFASVCVFLRHYLSKLHLPRDVNQNGEFRKLGTALDALFVVDALGCGSVNILEYLVQLRNKSLCFYGCFLSYLNKVEKQPFCLMEKLVMGSSWVLRYLLKNESRKLSVVKQKISQKDWEVVWQIWMPAWFLVAGWGSLRQIEMIQLSARETLF